MDWVLIIGLTGSILGIGGAIIRSARRARRAGTTLIGRFVTRHVAQAVADHVKPIVTAELQPVVAQMSHNGGSTVVDRLARLDQWRVDTTGQLDSIQKHLTRQDDEMFRHLRDHSRQR